MPTQFAVIDTGSNAIRLQVATVEQPGSYRIVEQERRPVRLGHKVFETGKLDKSSRREALDAFRKFKAVADRSECKTVRAIATSAMREASDAASFIEEAAEFGISLEILPEEEEARLISLGIASGLKFDLSMGLFMDIGGGSLEVAVANRTNVRLLLSVPLGAVRLTERYLKKDPPSEREITALQRHARRRLAPLVKRVNRTNFAMAFGSGGTVTTLADADARLTGDSHAESLYVLRRARLRSLFDLLRSQPLHEHAETFIGDFKRADIMVAGAAVLLSTMNQFDLDYLFVSRRGLRDGLMVDLLAKNYPKYGGAWTEEETRTESLEEIGEKYNYDKVHCQQVDRLAQKVFEQTRKLHKLPEKFGSILHAAAMLHDIGLFIGYPKHHKHSYYLIKSSLSGSSYDHGEMDLIANIARYHRKAHPTLKHITFGQLSPFQQEIVRKLSAILRVADALDFDHQSKIRDISCKLQSSKKLVIHVSGKGDLTRAVDYALEKAELMNDLYDIKTIIE